MNIGLVMDSGNLYVAAYKAGRALGMRCGRVSFAALRAKMAGGEHVLFAHAYVQRPPGLALERQMRRVVADAGWAPFLYERHGDTSLDDGPDAARTNAAARLVAGVMPHVLMPLSRPDILAIASGDSALLPLVVRARECRIDVVIYAFPGTVGAAMRRAASNVSELDAGVLFDAGDRR